MSIRHAIVAALVLLLVATAWWLLAGFAAAPGDAEGPRLAVEEGLEGDYPAHYVDELPLTDAPALPDVVTQEYIPAFERPDLIGDGMLVPVEIDLGEPQLPEGASEAP